jgi:hypothetical protein
VIDWTICRQWQAIGQSAINFQITKSPDAMNIDLWLKSAIADAEQRGMPELKAMLETLAQATRALRAAGFLDDPRGVGAPVDPSRTQA